MSTSPVDTPVLIVGGGPSGLAAALLLARQGLRPIVVERRSGTSVHPRARGLNVRTMEILRELGLEGAVQEAGAALADSRYMLFVDTLAGKEIRRVEDFDLVPVGDALDAVTPCDWQRCAQDELEPLLLAEARMHGAEMRFNTELSSFTQDESGVTAVLKDRQDGHEYSLRARCLIGADGAASKTRTILGIEREGIAPVDAGQLGYFVNVYFRADLASLVKGREFVLCFVEKKGADGLLLAVNNADRWLFNISYDPTKGETPIQFTPEHCIAYIRAAIGIDDLAVEVLSVLPWEGAALIATRFQVGKVFLVGDAAHVMPPAGGFGLNTGVQDVHNLAWKLALVLGGVAAPSLLETYEAERRPVAAIVVERAVQELTAPTPDSAPWLNDAEQGGDDVESWSNGQSQDDDGTWGEADPGQWGSDDLLSQLRPIMGYRYASTAVISEHPDEDNLTPGDTLDLSGREGTRAPHVWLQRGAERISTLDLFGSHFVVLTGPDGAPWCDGARQAAAELGLALDAHIISSDGVITDPGGHWLTSYGVDPGSAVLVRPDGFVAWRTRGASASPKQELKEVILRLLGRAQASLPA